MMLKNSAEEYGIVSKLFHWLIALAMIFLFAIGVWMIDLDYYDSAWAVLAPHYHESVGILLIFVMVLRIIWHYSVQQPLSLATHKKWEKTAAYYTHLGLSVIAFVLFFSGYLIPTANDRAISVFTWFSVPSMGELIENQEDLAGDIHRWFAYGFMGLMCLHALGALKHHFVDKDNTLKRML